MNRTKKRSRRYEDAKPDIQTRNNQRRMAIRLYRSINERTRKEELLKMATLLGVKGRSRMNIDQLRDAIYERTK